MQRSQVMRQFAFRSLVPVVVLVVVVGLVVRWSVERTVVDQWSAAHAGAWDAAVIPALDGADLSRDLDQAAVSRLNVVFAEQMRPGGVLNLKVFGPEGKLLYSADGEGIGAVFDGEGDLKRAMAGKVVALAVDESDEGDDSQPQTRLFGKVIEVYSPLRFEPRGPVEGVVEVYTSYEPVAGSVRSTTLTLWAVVAAGLGILYLSQVGVVRQIQNRLVESEDEVEEVNERLAGSMADLEEYSMGTLQALISAVDTKDSYTAKHSLGVTDYAVSVGRLMGLSERELTDLERACLLHDIGKIGVPEKVLLKPARLNDQEFEQIKAHSEMGARIIGSIPFLRDLGDIVLYHHERWDGRGYPEGLSGERIPALARIIGVADAFDAMTTDRPYRPAMRISAAREELVRFRGIQFDPGVVDAFVRAIDSGEIKPMLYHPAHDRGDEAVRAG
ncbi:MAG: HD-GYP domain-containing protein [Actinobacteria bacterium]|nr:MAG: HD-GYP domain-containing protein [Actinomycetota bacterium]